jgi:hypothetical protein
LKYSIHARSGFPPYDEAFKTSTPFPNFTQGENYSFSLKLKPASVEIDPQPKILSSAEETYDVIVYASPALRAGVAGEEAVDLSKTCLMNPPRLTESANLEGVGTYTHDPISDTVFSVTTRNNYSPKTFYESVVKEGVKHCPGYEPRI